MWTRFLGADMHLIRLPKKNLFFLGGHHGRIQNYEKVSELPPKYRKAFLIVKMKNGKKISLPLPWSTSKKSESSN